MGLISQGSLKAAGGRQNCSESEGTATREEDPERCGIRSLQQLGLRSSAAAALEADTVMTAKDTWKTDQTQCSGARALRLPEIKSWLLRC